MVLYCFLPFVCADTNPIMLFSVTDEIRKSFLQSDQGAFDELLPLEFATPPDIVSLAWESKNDTVFWADSESRSISSATIEVFPTTSTSLPFK